MLSKPLGPTGLYQISSTTGTHNATTFAGVAPLKVRIAVSGQSCVINFGGEGTADNNSDLLIPPGTVEHFKLDSTSTITFVEVTGGGANGLISITPVA
jgi:hypothetical protein